MAEGEHSAEDRSQPASEKRKADARREGRVVRSRELASFLILGTALAALLGLGPTLFHDSMSIIADGLTFDRAAVATDAAMGLRLEGIVTAAMAATLPILAILTAAAVVAPLALGGWNFSMKPLAPTLSKLNPMAGLGRIFDRHGLIEMGKSSLVAISVASIAGITVVNAREEFAHLAALPLAVGVGRAGSMVLSALGALLVVVALAALIDVPAQLWRHYSALKMTPEEVKRESKENDGDPQMKGRIRALQREIARRRMMEAVPTADVIVTNPTHFAVALKYDDAKMRAPTVVAKGTDLVALRIREIGTDNNVPVLEQPALARALHRHAEIGDEVPAPLYNAVAQVLAYVYQLKQFVPGMRLDVPAAVAVPAGMDPLAATGAAGDHA